MFLKRMEITGFKSFPDRIRLEFKQGLTAVVGPNGSGKSNIADAARWVMGEQSIKSLRGAKMEDIIFSGTQHRRPLGYAEVIMTLDNTDGRLPVEFSEVTVTRRVYRSGESEFALNGASCRLKDIQMLFMDTGVGREGYSIIGQGRIDEILSVRSEDRRLLFEEAAGIVKYKTRRNEALTKLERERQHLTRVNDIIDELTAQLEPLSLQAERAKTYLSLKEQYKIVHINIFLEDAQRIDAELAKTSEALADIAAQTENGERKLSEARLAGETLKINAASAEARYRQENERLIALITEIEKKESDVKLLETRLTHEQSNRERLTAELGKRDEAIARRQFELNLENTERTRTEEALAQQNARLAERQEEFASLDEAMRESEQTLNEYDRAIMEQVAVTADLKAKQRETENRYAQLEDAKERINGEISDNDAQLAEARDALDALDAAFAEHARALEAGQSLIEAYTEALVPLRVRRDELTAEHRRTQNRLQDAIARHKALSELEQHREGYYRSVKAVLRKKEEDPRFAGICGAVGELIGVPHKYETAVETALGGGAQNIVTRTEDDAKIAIEMLKSTREGRATFLPLTAVKGRVLDAEKTGLARERGFVGVASELVTSEAQYRPAVEHLLGNAVVMDNLDNALAVHKKFRYAYKLVTLDGELLSPGGAITGGGTAKSSTGIIGRAEHLRTLTGQLQEIRAEAQSLHAALREQEDKLSATDDALTRANAHRQALLLEQNNTGHQLSQAREKAERLQARANALEQENNRVMQQLVDTNAAIREAKRAVRAQDESVEQAQLARDEYRRQMTGERAQKDERVQFLSDIRVEIGRMTESLNASLSAITRLTRERDVFAAEKAALIREQDAAERSAQESIQKIQENRRSLADLKTRLSEQRGEISAIEAEKTELDAAIAQAEMDERVQMDETSRMGREITRLEMRKEQLDADSHRLYDEIWDEYGLTGQTAVAYKQSEVSSAHLRREEKRLKAELAPLTDVNVGAVEAYRQLKTRHEFMTAQRDDIQKAEDDLRDVVRTLTQQMESRFVEQFELISRHFNEVFREMFGGGRAGLSLLDDSNILESGIEITAQPPGKSLQTLLLLSGGERALTAIALLFGILRMKPSPFCVLDEIEAALDDANVDRFAEFLKQYSGETQFIVITHRKGTMEAADTLYGVTMEEVGISKLVSVKFVEEASGDTSKGDG